MQKNRWLLVLVLVLMTFYVVKLWYPSQTPPTPPTTTTTTTTADRSVSTADRSVSVSQKKFTSTIAIDAKTDARRVVHYLKQYQRLPDFYIRKGDARNKGWIASQGNLCKVLPGRAIGGDRFSNRERRLPESAGRRWYEADVNYQCGRRGSDRLLYSSDGLIYLTTDHYHSFKLVH